MPPPKSNPQRTDTVAAPRRAANCCSPLVHTPTSSSPDSEDQIPRGPPPHVYVEYHSNLDRMSIVVTLPTLSTADTKVTICPTDSWVYVEHDLQTASVVLPVRLPLTGHLHPTVTPGRTQLSWSVDCLRRRLVPLALNHGSTVPWSAPGLTSLGRRWTVKCRRCRAVLVGSHAISGWWDLPRPGWEELVEFWYCHRPAPEAPEGPESSEAAQVGPADGGGNFLIKAKRHFGLVDVMHIMFADEDIQGLTFSDSVFAHAVRDLDCTGSLRWLATKKNCFLKIFCTACQTPVGRYNFRYFGSCLFKWAIDFTARPAAPAAQDDPAGPRPPVAQAPRPLLVHCLAEELISIRDRTGAATIKLQGEHQSLIIWVMNPAINYSSTSTIASQGGVLAAKVFYIPSPAADEADGGSLMSQLAVAELSLPDFVIEQVRASLFASTRVLPPYEGSVVHMGRHWMVGLLKRWVEPLPLALPA